MRIIRLYHKENLTCGTDTFLNTEASNHVVRVLRSKADTPIVLFNGDGYNYNCKTLDTNSKKTKLCVSDRSTANNESNLSITLLQGVSRQDRMETTIQKSVELGVNEIIPILSQRSNFKIHKEKLVKKVEHWKKIALSACEQSGRCIIPNISNLLQLNEINDHINHDSLKLILDPTATISFKDIHRTHSTIASEAITIFIGPEGGLKEDEILSLKNLGFKCVNFGPRILRTETAGPAVISVAQLLWGDI